LTDSIIKCIRALHGVWILGTCMYTVFHSGFTRMTITVTREKSMTRVSRDQEYASLIILRKKEKKVTYVSDITSGLHLTTKVFYSTSPPPRSNAVLSQKLAAKGN
jgi:hypothetical protein